MSGIVEKIFIKYSHPLRRWSRITMTQIGKKKYRSIRWYNTKPEALAGK